MDGVFFNLEGHSNQTVHLEVVANIKHPSHGEALSGTTRLMSEVEALRKDKPQELARKKTQGLVEDTSGTEPETAAEDFKIDYKAVSGKTCLKQSSTVNGNQRNRKNSQAPAGE